MPRVAPGTTQRRSAAEMAVLEAELPRVDNGCGHYGVNAKSLYTTSNVSTKLCVDCYRERERLRQASYRGVTAFGRALKSAGHQGRREPIQRDPEIEAALGVLRDARGERTGHQGYVYLIGVESAADNPILQFAVKVGFSTNPEARVAELQTGNPMKLCLHAKIPGTRDDEARLHEKYAHLNILQEWFRPTFALLAEFSIENRYVPIHHHRPLVPSE